MDNKDFATMGFAGPERKIRFRQRSHVLPLPAGTEAVVPGGKNPGPHPVLAFAAVFKEQSWAADTALVRPVARGNGAHAPSPFETAASGRRFKASSPEEMLQSAPLFYLVLFPDGVDWVEENKVVLRQTAAEFPMEKFSNTL